MKIISPDKSQYCREDSDLVREKLRRLLGRKKHALRDCVKGIEPTDRVARRQLYQRLWDCGRTERRYRVADVRAVLEAKRIDPLHFLTTPIGRSPDSIWFFLEKHEELVSPKIGTITSHPLQSMGFETGGHRTFISNHTGKFWTWPSRALLDAQHHALARERARSEKASEGDYRERLLRGKYRAQNLREHWDLGSGPIPSMLGILFQAGVAVVKSPCEAKRKGANAVSGVFRGDTKFIGLGKDFEALSSAQKRYQLAVQLGRLYLRDETSNGDESCIFARALLMPYVARQFVYNHCDTPHGLRGCAQYFGITPTIFELSVEEWHIMSADKKWSECLESMKKASTSNASAISDEYC